jgi:predicted aspartyl protease
MFPSARLRLASFTLTGLIAAGALPIISSARHAPEPGQQLELGDALFAEGQFREALDAYVAARAAGDAAVQARAFAGIVKSLLRVAEFDRARDEGRGLWEFAPDDSEAVALAGDALWAAGLFDEGEAAYRDAMRLAGRRARAHHGMARVHASLSRYDAALEEARTAVAMDPDEAEYRHMLGAVFQRLRQYREAVQAYRAYVDRLPNRDRSVKAAWARLEIRFLEAFGRRAPLEIERDRPAAVHAIGFKLVHDKVVVQARVNGGAPVDFVVDTGAELTVVSPQVARRAGIVPITYMQSAGVGDIGLRGLQVGRLDSLQVGTLTVRNVPVLIKNPPLGGLPRREAESLSPLALGLSMAIDYPKRQLLIARHLPGERWETELPMRMHRLPLVRGVVNDQHPASFVLDTGGEVISLSLATAGALDVPDDVRRIPLKVYGTSGWDTEAFLLPGVDLAFQSVQFSNLPVVVLNLRAPSVLLGIQLGGTLGHRFLSPYRVGIDLNQGVVGLSRQSPVISRRPSLKAGDLADD